MSIAKADFTRLVGNSLQAITDEVVVTKGGRVVEQGPKVEMFCPPQ